MTPYLLKTLREKCSSLSLEAQEIIGAPKLGEMKTEALLNALPLSDRLSLYAHMIEESAAEPNLVNDYAWHQPTQLLSQSFDFRDYLTTATAIHTAMAGAPLRRYAEPDPFDREESDGFQTKLEREHQQWLAQMLAYFLPHATDLTPEQFISTRLSPEEQGKVLALLYLPSVAPSADVREARRLVGTSFSFQPESWLSFVETCRSIAPTPFVFEGLPTKRPISCDLTEQLLDDLNNREIAHRLSPQDIQNLQDHRLTSYLVALTGARRYGEITESFKATRSYLYTHMYPPKALSAHRQRQIDNLIYRMGQQDDAYFAQMDANKKGWHGMGPDQKKETLQPFLSLFCQVMETPSIPSLDIKRLCDCQRKSNKTPNGFFEAWKERDGKDLWLNRITLIDDVSDSGVELSCQMSMRATLKTTVHEAAHSDLYQYSYRLHESIYHHAYMSLFPKGQKPSPINTDHALHPTARMLVLYEEDTDRTSYITSECNFSLYYQQPIERCVNFYQHAFAAALNGALVQKQVLQGRDLAQELHALFGKIALALASRQDLTGSDADLIPLYYIDSPDPFFNGLLPQKGDPIDSVSRPMASRSVDLSRFDCKRAVLQDLQRTTPFRKKPSLSPDDPKALSFFKSSADFLAQMPGEIRLLKGYLFAEEKALRTNCDTLQRACQEMAEDLYDYSYVVTRQKARQAGVSKLQSVAKRQP